jgi:hypothetical protein
MAFRQRFVNLGNHPSAKWDAQMRAARDLTKRVEDIS